MGSFGVSGSVTCQVKLHSHSASQGTSRCQLVSSMQNSAEQGTIDNGGFLETRRSDSAVYWRIRDRRETMTILVAATINPMPSTLTIRDRQECDKADEFIRSCVRTACEAIRLFYASSAQPVAREDTVWLNHGITLGPTPYSTRLSGDGTR